MRTIYFIGNGTRSKNQLLYLKDKITFACNRSPLEWDEWPFAPHYYSTMEDPLYKNTLLDMVEKLGLDRPRYAETRKILPFYCEKAMDFPHTKYLKMVPYSCQIPGQTGNFVLRLGCTGSVCTWMCMAHLKFDHIVLIGCNAHRETIAECPTPVSSNPDYQEMAERAPGVYLKKTNDRHMRGWRRVAKWRDLRRPDTLILNASLESNIDCFPRIQLGLEDEYISGRMDLPSVKNPNYGKTH